MLIVSRGHGVRAPGGKFKARVRLTGNTAILSFAMADGSVFDVGSIAL